MSNDTFHVYESHEPEAVICEDCGAPTAYMRCAGCMVRGCELNPRHPPKPDDNLGAAGFVLPDDHRDGETHE
jgi:hypothetical protein